MFRNKLTDGRKFNSIIIIPVHGVQHFNCYQYRQGHCHWMWIAENFAVQTTEFVTTTDTRQVMCQLPVCHLWTTFREQEPPCSSADCGCTNITSNGHVTMCLRLKKQLPKKIIMIIYVYKFWISPRI